MPTIGCLPRQRRYTSGHLALEHFPVVHSWPPYPSLSLSVAPGGARIYEECYDSNTRRPFAVVGPTGLLRAKYGMSAEAIAVACRSLV